MAIGRISGPLLKSNLLRSTLPESERNLAFETDLLYLDIINSKIGINSDAPEYDLDVVGTTNTTDLIVTNNLTVGNFNVTANTISSNLSTINFVAASGEATAYHSRLIVNDIELNGNAIYTTVSNANLELRPHGTGIVDIQSNARVTGDLTVQGNINATGNITIGGNIIIGDSLTDTITVNASIKSDLIPESNNTYDLGSSSFKWNTLYANNVNSTTLSLTSLEIGYLNFTDNIISTDSGHNLVLDPNGTGSVRIGNFAIKDNTITNVVSGAITEIAQTGAGYLKISGTNGFVPPIGDTSQRPWFSAVPTAVVGMTRYNTDSNALEVWDGVTWASPAGTIGAVSESGAIEIAIQYALTIG